MLRGSICLLSDSLFEFRRTGKMRKEEKGSEGLHISLFHEGESEETSFDGGQRFTTCFKKIITTVNNIVIDFQAAKSK